jgi:hypothetical protein
MTQEQINYCQRLGFNWWQDTTELNDDDFIIIVDGDGKFKIGTCVKVKYISQYNIDFWIHPHKLNANTLRVIADKMDYTNKQELLEYMRIHNL